MKWRADRDGNVTIDDKPSVVDMVKGAVGVAKAAVGIGAASTEDYRARWAICMACDQHDAGRCRTCGCFTGAKVRVAQSHARSASGSRSRRSRPAPSHVAESAEIRIIRCRTCRQIHKLSISSDNQRPHRW